MGRIFPSTKRGLVAATWSIVNILTFVSFAVALTFCMSSASDNSEKVYYYNQGNSGDKDQNNNEMDPELAVTSRAMAFAAMWTVVSALLLSIFGTVILGWQSPTGQYYTCCSREVHKTTPITLGGFIGALLMFANLALVCAAFFGEFEVRDFRQHQRKDKDEDGEKAGEKDEFEFFAIRRKGTSTAFSVLCLFLAILYGSFAALALIYSNAILDELEADETENYRETKQVGLTPLPSPRLSSQSSHFVRPQSTYHNHTGSLGAFVTPGPPNPTGTLA